MFNVQYIVHSCTRTHAQTNLVHGTGQCVHLAVHREAYTVSQSTSPSDPFRGLPGGVLRQQLARQSIIDVQHPRGSLSDLRSEPAPELHCMSRSKYLPCRAHRTHTRYSISLITTDGVLAQHSSQPARRRHLEWSKIVYRHAGQGRGLLVSSPAAGGESFDLALPTKESWTASPALKNPCILVRVIVHTSLVIIQVLRPSHPPSAAIWAPEDGRLT